VQKALAAGETCGFLKRNLGGGRKITTSYELRFPSGETLNGGAPFEETLNVETVFEPKTLNSRTRNPVPPFTRTLKRTRKRTLKEK